MAINLETVSPEEKRAIEARRAYFKEYRQKNAQRIREYQKEYRNKNREKIKGCSKSYWLKKADEMGIE